MFYLRFLQLVFKTLYHFPHFLSVNQTKYFFLKKLIFFTLYFIKLGIKRQPGISPLSGIPPFKDVQKSAGTNIVVGAVWLETRIHRVHNEQTQDLHILRLLRMPKTKEHMIMRDGCVQMKIPEMCWRKLGNILLKFFSEEIGTFFLSIADHMILGICFAEFQAKIQVVLYFRRGPLFFQNIDSFPSNKTTWIL